MTIDDFDRRILRVVQQNNQKTHGQIGDIVGLSASAVRRRLDVLRRSKSIIADVSIVAPELHGLTFITQVKLNVTSMAGDQKFRKSVCEDAAVSLCYSVSGEFDYVLHVQANDPESYEEWGKRSLLEAEYIASYTTTLVWKQIKHNATTIQTTISPG